MVQLQIGKTGLNFMTNDEMLDVLRYETIELDTMSFDDTTVLIRLMDGTTFTLTTDEGPAIVTAVFTQANKLLQMIRAAEPQRSTEELAAQELWASMVEMFNEESSSKAIDAMQEHGLVEPTAAGVARLFREKVGDPKNNELTKAEIGEYIAKNKEFNKEVRERFIETFDFTGMSFVASLRAFLKTFRLPGESMLIERLFSTWALRFYHNNPGDFARNQLTEQKIAGYRKAFDAMSVSEAIAEPTAEEPSSDMSKYMKGVEIVHEGYLTKKGEKRKSWKNRYFQIHRTPLFGDQLVYLEKENGKEKGRIDLTMCQAVQMSMEDILGFSLLVQKDDGRARDYEFKAPDENACMMWCNAINTSLALHLSQKADHAADQIQKSGQVPFAQFEELVKSLGGDFKYIKKADLLEMQQVTASDMREVASILGHELSFKEVREKTATAVRRDGTFDFITFVSFMALKVRSNSNGLKTFVLLFHPCTPPPHCYRLIGSL